MYLVQKDPKIFFMENRLVLIIDEAIELELNMSKLYGTFSEYLNRDRAFWFRIAIEEKNHAALLKTGREFIHFNKFPLGLVPENLEFLKTSNRKVREAIKTFLKNPDREQAFRLALELEKSAGEKHFQLFMEKGAKDSISDIFHRLNQADKDHEQRIKAYWESTSEKIK